MSSLEIFSCLIIVLCDDDDDKMLIISRVEICSKPMAILLYDDFYVCLSRLVVVVCWRDIIFLTDLYVVKSRGHFWVGGAGRDGEAGGWAGERRDGD